MNAIDSVEAYFKLTKQRCYNHSKHEIKHINKHKIFKANKKQCMVQL